MSQEINISLVSKETPTVNLSTTASGDVQATVGDTTPIVSFIATGEKGATGATGSASITDGSITNAKLASSSVSSSKLASASVSSSKLRENAVTTTKIADHAVTAGKIALGSLTEALIDIFEDGAIKPGKLKPGSLLEENFALLSVGTNVIKNESVTAGKLANGIIETIKIVDNAVTTAKIATNAVTGNEIQNSVTLNGTVTLNHLDLSGSSPAVIKGPDADALHIKTNTVVNFLNTSDTIVASVDQQGNLTLSGTVDGIDLAVAVPLNTAKVGITPDQTNAIIANTIKTGITTEQASAITANTNKTGITTSQSSAITANTAKTGITTSQANAITANTAKPDLTVDGAGTVHSNNYTNTVYTHPSSHPISLITGLQTALNAKQDSIGNEDLTIQQTDGLQDALDAKVDDSQVLTNVPANAVFTDTVYTHPTNHAISVITGLQTELDSKQDGIGSEDLTIAMTDGLQAALDGKVDDSQVLTNVPANAVFTDTNTTYSIQDGELSQNNFTDADHTKLNNIEANATADQTKADIDALGIAATTAVSLTAGNKTIDGDLILGGDDDDSHYVTRFPHADNAGGRLYVQAGNAGGTNKSGGSLFLNAGRGTGAVYGGNIIFQSSLPGSSGSLLNNEAVTAILNSTGTLLLEGGLTVKGDIIKSNAGTVFTFDSSGNTTVSNTLNATLTGDVTGNVTGSSGTVTNIGSLTGDVTSSNRATTIANDAVTYAKMQDVSATNVVLGRDSAGAGVVEEISAANLRTIINVEDGADVTDATNVTASGALMDSELTDLAGVKGVTISTLQVKPSEGAFANGDKTKLDSIAANATADQTNVTGSSGSCTGNAATATALTTGNKNITGTLGVTELITSKQRHLLRCGFYGGSLRMYLPFNYGGPFESTSTSGYSEYGAVIMPCDGYVESVIIRSEEACGNSQVAILVASNGTEVPTLSPGTFASPWVNMAADDTSYKFTGFVNQGGTSNSFSAGDVIMIAFDPTNSSNDSTATAVLVFDWNNQL
jgi:hypothetical protein